MAKELPYFKFEPNQWENGNIQIFNHQEKGVFMDLCSMYWSRLGDLHFKLAVGKICNGNATVLQSLCDEQIIEVIDGKIFIKFLSEQLSEFEDVSEKNSQNAKIRWEKHRKEKELNKNNATALQSQSEPNAIREEKIKEDKIKENNIVLRGTEFKNSLKQFLDVFGKDTLNDFYLYWTETKPNGKKMRYEMEKTFNIERRLQRWSKNNFNNNNNQKAENNEQLKNITTSIRSSNPEL